MDKLGYTDSGKTDGTDVILDVHDVGVALGGAVYSGNVVIYFIGAVLQSCLNTTLPVLYKRLWS